MAISARKRRSLPKSSFIYPSRRKYPIDTKQRARSALRLGAQRSTFGSPATIRAAVYKRYPSLRPGSGGRKKSSGQGGKRRSRK